MRGHVVVEVGGAERVDGRRADADDQLRRHEGAERPRLGRRDLVRVRLAVLPRRLRVDILGAVAEVHIRLRLIVVLGSRVATPDEVREGEEEGADAHEHGGSTHPAWPVVPLTKVADKDDRDHAGHIVTAHDDPSLFAPQIVPPLYGREDTVGVPSYHEGLCEHQA